MKVELELLGDGSPVVTVEEAFAGAVVMPCDQGTVSIQHRDGGIEVSLDGKPYWSSISGYTNIASINHGTATDGGG